jgi:lipopolysaccharide/colanic/teichoic acid biosynthesis glycosyltransferase
VTVEAREQRSGKRGYLSLEGVDVSSIHRRWQLTNTLWAFLQRVVALLLIIFAVPFGILLYVPVRIASRGSFLYRQKRPGFMGREFTILKIRTMRVNSDADPSLQKGVAVDNPNVTRIGRFLRASKIDELPQLINVYLGDMEFVGPRPIAFGLNDLLAKHIPGFNHRYLVKPGLTNLSQVSVIENAIGDKTIEDWKLRFEGEEHYIANKSIAYDLILIVMTLVFMWRGAFRTVFRRR